MDDVIVIVITVFQVSLFLHLPNADFKFARSVRIIILPQYVEALWAGGRVGLSRLLRTEGEIYPEPNQNFEVKPTCTVRTKVLPQYVEALRADGRVGFIRLP